MRNFINSIAVLMLISLWGCGKGNSNSVALDASGKHPAGWVDALNGGNHSKSYLASPDACKECHGADLTGGISKVSCLSADRNGISCHAQGPSGHPAGWALPTAHGAHAKSAAVGADGMAFCTNCHGADYRGAGFIQKDCLRCHVTAPHPPKPWSGGTFTHTTTDTSNAPACALCHTGGANLSTIIPATPSGATGCFNNTLCHGVMGHPFPYGGSAHRPGGTGTLLANAQAPYTNCSSCHDTTTAGGTYPVARGVKPLCSACHLNMTNFGGATPGCWDCHGASPTDGRPNGTTFPNRQGSSDGHNRSTHQVNCTVCHPFSTGNASHGWSNGTKSSNAQVVPALNWNPGTRQAGTGSCSPSSISGCHDLKSGWY